MNLGSGNDYSNIFLYPLRWKSENRYFCLFSFFITVAMMQQHIKKDKEEKRHGASEGYKKYDKNRNVDKMRLWMPCENSLKV